MFCIYIYKKKMGRHSASLTSMSVSNTIILMTMIDFFVLLVFY